MHVPRMPPNPFAFRLDTFGKAEIYEFKRITQHRESGEIYYKRKITPRPWIRCKKKLSSWNGTPYTSYARDIPVILKSYTRTFEVICVTHTLSEHEYYTLPRTYIHYLNLFFKKKNLHKQQHILDFPAKIFKIKYLLRNFPLYIFQANYI